MTATPAQIANDLDAQAKYWDCRGFDPLVRSLRRGAKTIRDMRVQALTPERVAEEQAEQLIPQKNSADFQP